MLYSLFSAKGVITFSLTPTTYVGVIYWVKMQKTDINTYKSVYLHYSHVVLFFTLHFPQIVTISTTNQTHTHSCVRRQVSSWAGKLWSPPQIHAGCWHHPEVASAGLRMTRTQSCRGETIKLRGLFAVFLKMNVKNMIYKDLMHHALNEDLMHIIKFLCITF